MSEFFDPLFWWVGAIQVTVGGVGLFLYGASIILEKSIRRAGVFYAVIGWWAQRIREKDPLRKP